MNTNPRVRLDDIAVQKSGDGTLVYDLQNNRAYCLNETSALIYDLCDGRKSVQNISDELSKKMKSLVSEEFVELAISQFSRDGLLENDVKVDSTICREGKLFKRLDLLR